MLKTLFGLLALLLLPLSAAARSNQPMEYYYVGIKGGDFEADIDGVQKDKGYGIQLGFNSTRTWAMELEYTKATLSTTEANGSADIDIKSKAIYVTYRSEGNPYLIGKMGYIDNSADSTATAFSSQLDESGYQYGAGLGYQMSHMISIEIERLTLQDRVTFAGINIRFRL